MFVRSEDVSSSRSDFADAGAPKSGRGWPNLAACSALARPYLDGCEHDGTAWCGRNDDQRGARFRARFESRHNLVSGRSKDLNHDAVMRIGSEAPKRRTHSSNRHEAKGHVGIPPPRTIIGAVTSERTRPKLSRYLQHPPFIVQDATFIAGNDGTRNLNINLGAPRQLFGR